MTKRRPVEWFDWQVDAFDVYRQAVIKGHKDFLAAVSGGGGKTIWALENARLMLQAGQIKRLIVVTFTEHLVKQWDAWATAIGLNLLAVTGNQKLKEGMPEDCQGYICTYAAMGRMPDLHAAFTGECPTLVVFDEIHHLDDMEENTDISRGWGKAAKIAFELAAFRLALSGTPFRSNSARIPFIVYEPREGSNTISKAVHDFSYSYGEAVADRVCRRVIFEDVDGLVEWKRNDIAFSHRFADELEARYANDRLMYSTWLDPEFDDGARNDLLRDLLIRSNNRLSDLRKAGHADAGGLIVANNIIQAKLIRKYLRKLTGHNAVIVHNEEETSRRDIAAFTDGIAPWIISVKMITEGVDIPRLRVCVYAASVVTDLFFTQVLFRIVRKTESGYGESYFYYPADARLKAIAREIEKEVERWIVEREKRPRKPGESTPAHKSFIGAKAETWSSTIAGETCLEDDVRMAEQFRAGREELAEVDILDFVKFFHDFRRYKETPASPNAEESYNEKRERLRRGIQKKVGQINNRTGKPFNEIHIVLNDQVGVRGKGKATLEQLEKMVTLANEWLATLDGNGNGSEQDDEDELF